jgi:hypothetical protein
VDLKETLFGRNTSAGALNITTQKPVLVGGYVEASYGNLDENQQSSRRNRSGSGTAHLHFASTAVITSVTVAYR